MHAQVPVNAGDRLFKALKWERLKFDVPQT